MPKRSSPKRSSPKRSYSPKINNSDLYDAMLDLQQQELEAQHHHMLDLLASVPSAPVRQRSLDATLALMASTPAAPQRARIIVRQEAYRLPENDIIERVRVAKILRQMPNAPSRSPSPKKGSKKSPKKSSKKGGNRKTARGKKSIFRNLFSRFF